MGLVKRKAREKEGYLGIAEMTAILKINKRTVYNKLKQFKVPCEIVGNKYFVKKDNFERLLSLISNYKAKPREITCNPKKAGGKKPIDYYKVLIPCSAGKGIVKGVCFTREEASRVVKELGLFGIRAVATPHISKDLKRHCK